MRRNSLICVGTLSALSVCFAQEQPVDDPIYRVGGGVTAPSVASKVDPAYTKEARAARMEGSVLLSLVVGKDGVARDIRVIRPLGAGLDDEAVRTVQKWKFVAGRKNGEPVSVMATIEMNFQLLKRPPANGPPGSVKIIRILSNDPLNQSLLAPKLTSPEEGAVFDVFPRALTLKWEPSPGALSYIVEWDYAEGAGWHSEIENNQRFGMPVRLTNAEIDFVGAQPGRWRVWPVDEKGQRGTASEWRGFRFTR